MCDLFVTTRHQRIKLFKLLLLKTGFQKVASRLHYLLIQNQVGKLGREIFQFNKNVITTRHRYHPAV